MTVAGLLGLWPGLASQRAPVPPGLLGLTLSRVCWRTASPFSWAEMALQHRCFTAPPEPCSLLPDASPTPNR